MTGLAIGNAAAALVFLFVGLVAVAAQRWRRRRDLEADGIYRPDWPR